MAWFDRTMIEAPKNIKGNCYRFFSKAETGGDKGGFFT